MPIQLDIEELKLSFGLVPIKTDLLCLTRAAGFTKRKCLIFREKNPVYCLDNCLVFLGGGHNCIYQIIIVYILFLPICIPLSLNPFVYSFEKTTEVGIYKRIQENHQENKKKR